MLHQLLVLTRPLIVADTETTGLDKKKDRIIEIGFQRWTSEGLTKEWRSLINPGVPFPENPKHKITTAMVTGCRDCGRQLEEHRGLFGEDCAEFRGWPTFKALAENLAKGFSNCDFAGKNIRFDLGMFSEEFARAGVSWSTLGARVIDADRLEQLGDPRTLSDLYRKHTGEELQDAHQALVDVQATTTVITSQLQRYQTVLPRDLDLLHALQWPGWLDLEGKFQFIDGVACVGRWGKHAGKPMKNVDSGYWDFILAGDFSSDVKALAADAKLGKFPEEKR